MSILPPQIAIFSGAATAARPLSPPLPAWREEIKTREETEQRTELRAKLNLSQLTSSSKADQIEISCDEQLGSLPTVRYELEHVRTLCERTQSQESENYIILRNGTQQCVLRNI